MESKRIAASRHQSTSTKAAYCSEFSSTSTSNQCSGQLPIPHLPHELIIEILLRLPVKSLLKFRCVSKSWFSLISSSYFVEAHLRTSVNNPEYRHHRLVLHIRGSLPSLKHCSLQSLLYAPTTDAININSPVKELNGSFNIVGSCNGLVCLTDQDGVYLWNPSTRKSKKLQGLRYQMRYGYRCMSYGFGYNEYNDDYKVVGILCASDSGGPLWSNNARRLDAMVYSLKANSWTRVSGFSRGESVPPTGKFANGKVYWASRSSVILIDLVKESYGEMELPDHGEENGLSTLGVLGDRLCLLHDDFRTRVDMWFMEELGMEQSWIKVYSIPYGNDRVSKFCKPLLYNSKSSEIVMLFGFRFTVYNLNDGSLRYPKITNCAACDDGHIYLESLVSPWSDDSQ